jgi:hypothetical protein
METDSGNNETGAYALKTKAYALKTKAYALKVKAYALKSNFPLFGSDSGILVLTPAAA